MRDVIKSGVAAVRRGGVRVVARGQAEVADRLGASFLDDVFSRSHQLDDDQRQVGKAQRVGAGGAWPESPRAPGVGLLRQRLAELACHLDDALPALGRTHHATQRRAAGGARKRAVHAVGRDHEFLDQLAGAVCTCCRMSTTRSPSNTARGWKVSQFERALRLAPCPQALRDGILRLQLQVHAGHRSGRCRAAHRCRRSTPTPRRRRAWPGCAPSRARPPNARPRRRR